MDKKRKVIPVDLSTEKISLEDLGKISGGTGDEEIEMPPGELCPGCGKTTLYALGVPGILGHPTTVYEMCVNCGYSNQYDIK